MDKTNSGIGGCLVEMTKGHVLGGTELELWETEADRQRVLALLENFGFAKEHKLVAIGVTASAPLKQWPVARYGELVNRLRARRHDLRFVLLGDAIEQGEEMAEAGFVLNLCGQLTLRETVALLRHVSLYVGNDTGLMHMAAACGCSVVEVTGMAADGDIACGISTIRFSPWVKESAIVRPARQLECCHGMCQMSYAHCIKQVTVEAVLEASCSLLADKI